MGLIAPSNPLVLSSLIIPGFPGAPGIPGGPFGPPIGIPTIPGLPEIPGIPGLPPVGAQVCPPGTKCVGPSVSIGGGFSGCLGFCADITPTGDPRDGNGLGPKLGPDFPTPEAPVPVPGRRGGCPSLGQGTTLACPAGCHPNKSDYFLKSGSFVAKGSRCVRNRRRNPLNPRALDRAAGRLRSAKKLTAFLGSTTVPKRRR